MTELAGDAEVQLHEGGLSRKLWLHQRQFAADAAGKLSMIGIAEGCRYGLKGMAAYACHARRLGKSDENVCAFIEEALFATMTNVNFDVPTLLEMCLECGKQNLRVMELLDQGHVENFGKPEPTTVTEGTQAGPGILITGHDMMDLWTLLKQCEGTDIKVYTHGEMLPAHMYPKLSSHPNLAGHYGGAWYKQKREFEAFPGPVLATTNCILIPKESYKDRVFTTRCTAVPGGVRLTDDEAEEIWAAWSPDGEWIAIGSSSLPAEPMTYWTIDRVYLLNPFSGEEQELNTTRSAYDGRWSPDSSQLIYRIIPGDTPGESFIPTITCVLDIATGEEQCSEGEDNSPPW